MERVKTLIIKDKLAIAAAIYILKEFKKDIKECLKH